MIQSTRETYQRFLEVVSALLELLKRLILTGGALDNRGNAGLADIVENGFDLIESRRLLSDLEIKLRPQILFSCLDLDLLEQSSHSFRAWRASLVEKGDDIFGLAL